MRERQHLCATRFVNYTAVLHQVLVPGEHAHEVQTEIHAEARAGNDREMTSATLRLPPEFQRVLVVSYQPRQVWVQPGTPSPAIRF